jgi:hypothetical protein
MKTVPEWFQELDAARIRRGHSKETACGVLRISRYTWDNWKSGMTPRGAQKEMVSQYMSGGK